MTGRLTIALIAALHIAGGASGQATLQKQPGYDRYRAVQQASRELSAMGRIGRIDWSDDGSHVTFRRDGETVRFDLNRREFVKDVDQDADGDAAAARRSSRQSPARGRQRDVEPSPNGRWTARSSDWNVSITDNESDRTVIVTTDGWRKFRYGTASWVYGEELDQRDAMWWSPDSTMLAFYEFDERDVPDHYHVTGWTDLHTDVEVEGYPKPGEPNPVPALIIYDVESGDQLRIDTTTEPDQYVFRVQFSADGSELLFFRTNRRQNKLQFVAADVETGALRIVLTETQETWQDNRPYMRFLDDGQRFIWETQRSGFAHLELRHLNGERLNGLTQGAYPIQRVERTDEQRGELWYTAYSGGNPLDAQIHRVQLDGSGVARLTQRDANYTSIDVSPDGNWFITTFETIRTPATTVLCDRDGSEAAVLARADDSAVAEAPIVLPELFTCTAVDGETVLYGVLHKPSDFDPNRRYPLVIDVYGGPFSQGVRNRFSGARAECEFGYLVAEIDNRGTVNRGKSFESATYLKLGEVDIADQVTAVRELCSRPYVDERRVGIYGSSYGGYMAALAILRYPDVFHVAVAGSAVTDWRQYDSIYTERYMRTPQENEAGYDAGSCMTYADNLRGHLLLQLGLLDNNVHPSNTFALAEAIREAGGDVDVSIHPDRGHRIGMAGYIERLNYLREHLLDQDDQSDAARPAPEEVGAAQDVVY